MNPSDPQGELLPPSPVPRTEPTLPEVRDFFAQQALRTAEEIGQLKRQAEVQRTLFLGLLMALLVLSGSVNILTVKQMRMARDQLNDMRPKVVRLYTDFREVREPAVKRFVGALQDFARTHRDFQPALERYRPFLPQYFTGPATPAPLVPAIQTPVPPPRPASK
jgi:hypothetical protein